MSISTGNLQPAGKPTTGQFPDQVIEALHHAALTLTCLPVRIDHAGWQAAFFYVLSPDAPCILGGSAGRLPAGPYAVSLTAELHEHACASVVEIGLEIATPAEPLCGTVMLMTGHNAVHFDTLRLLSEQHDIPLFLGDAYCRIIHSQRVPAKPVMRRCFREFLDTSVSRDAVIRLTGRYDADAAFSDVFKERRLA